MAIDVAVVQATKLKGNPGDVLTKTETGVQWRPLSASGGAGMVVDAALDVSSSNPVQNKAIAVALNSLPDGFGLPSGGRDGQVLVRKGSDSYSWLDPLSLPEGAPGQVLMLDDNLALMWAATEKLPRGRNGEFLMHGEGSDSYAWAPLPDVFPEGGDVNDVLVKTASGQAWSKLSQASPTGMIDSELDSSSSNPVKNKAIYAGLELKQNRLPEGAAGTYLVHGERSDSYAWIPLPDVGGAVFPSGGVKGDVLALDSDSLPAWTSAYIVPEDGNAGEVLTMGEDGELLWTPVVQNITIQTSDSISITIDGQLDASSSNPVQNKAIVAALAFKQDRLPRIGWSEGDVLAHGAGSDSYAWRPMAAAGAELQAGEKGQFLWTNSDSDVSWTDVERIPDGGAAGQVLGLDGYGALAWRDTAIVPDGGTAGQRLGMNDTSDGLAWLDKELPDGGAAGDILVMTTNGPEWHDVSFSGIGELFAGGNENEVWTKTANGPAWAPLPAAEPGASDVSTGEAVLMLKSKLDLNSAEYHGESRIYIANNKNLSTREDGVPEIDFLGTKDAMLGHEYCAVFTSRATDMDVKPSADVFPWVPWPVEDGEWSSSESSLSISDPWADHPNMGGGSYQYVGTEPGYYPDLKGTGYIYSPDPVDTTGFWLGEPSVDQSRLYGKWKKHTALILDNDGQYAGEYVWDAGSARYLSIDGEHKIIPLRTVAGRYSWVATDVSESDVFPEFADPHPADAEAVNPPDLRRVVWERVVDDKYTYRTVLRPDKTYTVAVADVDPCCNGAGAEGGGGGSGSCGCAGELSAIKAELLLLMALHSKARLTVRHSSGEAPSGAAWDVDSDSDWHAFGASAVVDAGAHSVGFRPVDGYTAPSAIGVTLSAGEDRSVSAAYAAVSGIDFTMMYKNDAGDPPSGAAWSLDGGQTWHEFGYVIHDIEPGTYTATFKAVEGYTSPEDEQVVIDAVLDHNAGIQQYTTTAYVQTASAPSAFTLVTEEHSALNGTYSLVSGTTTTYNGNSYPVYQNGSNYLAIRSNGRPAINASADVGSTGGWGPDFNYTAGAVMAAASLTGTWYSGSDDATDTFTFTETA